MSLKISSTLSLPATAVGWVIAYLAKRGAGKTYSAADQAEEMLRLGIPIVVLDGMGVWWGLRVGKDGTGSGLPIVVFGGEHADLPLLPEKVQQMARAIVESNISCVLDLSGFSKGQMKKIVGTFLDELFKINRVDRHVYIEEADMFAPQRTIGPEDAICAGAVGSFVRRGGNHNLGVTLITQRSAVLNKDVLTQADCLVILRTLAPQDKKAIQLWVEEQTDEDKTKLNKWYDSLKELENGEAWVWHPEKPVIYKKIHFRERETFHATRENLKTPQAASIKLMDVGDFISKFKAVFESKPKPVTITTPIQIPHEEPTFPKRGITVGFQGKRFNVLTGEITEPSVPSEPKPMPTRTIPDGIGVMQAKPTLLIEQYKPQLQIPVEALDQPTTPLGKLAVILKNSPSNPGKWTMKRVVDDIKDHGWDAAGVGEAIDQLLHWEILTKGHDGNYMKAHLSRIQTVEHTEGLGVQ